MGMGRKQEMPSLQIKRNSGKEREEKDKRWQDRLQVWSAATRRPIQQNPDQARFVHELQKPGREEEPNESGRQCGDKRCEERGDHGPL